MGSSSSFQDGSMLDALMIDQHGKIFFFRVPLPAPPTVQRMQVRQDLYGSMHFNPEVGVLEPVFRALPVSFRRVPLLFNDACDQVEFPVYEEVR